MKRITLRTNEELVKMLIYKTQSKTQNEAIEFAINYTLANYKNELSETKDLAIRKVVEKIALENYQSLLDKHNDLKKQYVVLLNEVVDLNTNVHKLLMLKTKNNKQTSLPCSVWEQ